MIYIYMCVCVRACVRVCVYTLQAIIFAIFWLSWLFVFVSITSNSFHVKSDYFCLLKIWIYELKCSTMKTILWAFKNTEHFQRKVLLSYYRNCFCWYQCKNFKSEWNSVVKICSEFYRSSFFKKYNSLRILAWNKVSQNLVILLYYCLAINNIYRPNNKILFWSVGQYHRRSEVSLFLIYFTNRTKLH